MSIEVNRPSDASKSKPKLTKLGVIVVALVAVVIVGALGISASNRAKRQRLETEAQVVVVALDHAVSVCKNVVAAAGSSSDSARLDAMIDSIDSEKDILKKADLANDMIGYCLKIATSAEQQSFIDELNGARNRIQVALREYNS